MTGNEWWIFLSLALLAGIVGGVVSTRYLFQHLKSIVAERICITREEGRPGILLNLDSKGLPCLSFYDKDGEPRILLGMLDNDEPTLTLYDKGNNPRTALVQPNGEPAMLLYDKNNNPRFTLALYSGEPSLDIYDEGRKVIWNAPD